MRAWFDCLNVQAALADPDVILQEGRREDGGGDGSESTTKAIVDGDGDFGLYWQHGTPWILWQVTTQDPDDVLFLPFIPIAERHPEYQRRLLWVPLPSYERVG